MARGNNARDRYLYGICTNRDNGDGKPCSKCVEKTIQQIRAGKDFVCEECGEKLTKVAPPSTTNWALIGGIAAAVIVLGGGGAYLALSGGDTTKENIEVVQTDTISSGDSSAVEEVVEKEAEEPMVAVEAITIKETEEDLQLPAGDEVQLTVEFSPEGASDKLSWISSDDAVATVSESGLVTAVKAGKATVKVATQEGAKTASVVVTVKAEKAGETNVPARINLPYGYFEGPTNGNGKPNGIGIAYVTKGYSLDLKNRNKETLDLKPGDKIMNAKFKDGNLQQGELQRKNGTRKTLQIGG